MKKATKFLTFLTLTVLVSISVYAQNPGDPGEGEDPDASIPLDGGLVSVLLSGAGIGVYKLIKQKRSK